jgi:3-phenylpropionate/trans-cinnamate dioxygenase ferredoxin subunit
MTDEQTLVRLCRTDEIPLNEGRRFDVSGHPIAVFRIESGFYAIGDTCSHEESSLSQGFVEDDVVECPKHGAMFDIATGKNLSLPATRPVPAYRVVVEGDDVYLEAPNGQH